MNHTPLSRPQRVTEQDWPADTTPVVSICCITYNQKNYLTQTIESFLMQETTFPVEILIHDDASTDGTPDIIRDYQKRYPKLIKPVLQSENQFSKGIRRILVTFLLPQARGEYIAFCEGDDYWTSPAKLELQVAYLRNNPAVVLCFHDVTSVDEAGNELSNSLIAKLMGGYQPARLENLYRIGRSLIPTLSILFRNLPVVIGPQGQWVLNGDTYLFAMLARYGEMHNIGKTMAAYRCHASGVWTPVDAATKKNANLQTLAAIAREVDLDNCPAACCNYAEVAWDGLRNSLGRESGKHSIKFLRAYFTSLFCCFRLLRAGWRHFPSLVATQGKIVALPAHWLWDSKYNLLRRFSKSQS